MSCLLTGTFCDGSSNPVACVLQQVQQCVLQSVQHQALTMQRCSAACWMQRT
jgi:hypothetical protein